MLVYVDDVIITDNYTQVIQSLIDLLNNECTIKDLGKLHYFLRLKLRILLMVFFCSKQNIEKIYFVMLKS